MESDIYGYFSVKPTKLSLEGEIEKMPTTTTYGKIIDEDQELIVHLLDGQGLISRILHQETGNELPSTTQVDMINRFYEANFENFPSSYQRTTLTHEITSEFIDRVYIKPIFKETGELEYQVYQTSLRLADREDFKNIEPILTRLRRDEPFDTEWFLGKSVKINPTNNGTFKNYSNVTSICKRINHR